jgi:hypothetical protein
MLIDTPTAIPACDTVGSTGNAASDNAGMRFLSHWLRMSNPLPDVSEQLLNTVLGGIRPDGYFKLLQLNAT